MAQIAESTVVIKASRLVRDDQQVTAPLDDSLLDQLSAIVQELAGEGTLVEIIKE
tara:strand:+ start:7584 stop:7748 length:165 start_codon:yes stop_codon:yes gene_type:complete